MKKYKRTVLHSKAMKSLIQFLQRRKFPGYPEISWYAVIEFFIRWVDQKDMQMRARSLSFSFFLALFPSAIFFFTLIAYLPFTRSHDQILFFFSEVMPASAFATVRETLEDILKHQRSGLLSIGFFSAIYFSTNGFHSLMNSFNKYSHQRETRPFYKQRIVAVILACTVSLSLLFSVTLITGGAYLIKMMDKLKYFPSKTTPLLLGLLNYVIVTGICLTVIATIYYFAPSKKRKFKFISPGVVFATISIMVTMSLFSFYVNEFNSYNKVYGSIGALIVIMLIIYFNTYIILLGFEFDVTIDKAVEETSKGRPIKANSITYLRANHPGNPHADGH